MSALQVLTFNYRFLLQLDKLITVTFQYYHNYLPHDNNYIEQNNANDDDILQIERSMTDTIYIYLPYYNHYLVM